MDDQGTNRTRGSGLRFRKLRITWSVVWGIACLLLIVLWVRSYFSFSVLGYGGQLPKCQLLIMKGEIIVKTKWPTSLSGGQWTAITDQPSDWLSRTNNYDTVFGFALFPFRNKRLYYDYCLFVPFWSVVALGVLLSGLPWMPRPRFVARFSLSTLLVFTTLVAVGLGLIVWAARK